jgi:hypothetical protein
MNHAKLDKSERMQRLYRLLQTGAEFTTRQIAEKARVEAVSTAISELRKNISPRLTVQAQRRGDLWFYRMVMQ